MQEYQRLSNQPYDLTDLMGGPMGPYDTNPSSDWLGKLMPPLPSLRKRADAQKGPTRRRLADAGEDSQSSHRVAKIAEIAMRGKALNKRAEWCVIWRDALTTLNRSSHGNVGGICQREAAK